MSLNKFTDSSVRKEWMNINCADMECKTLSCDNPPWNHGSAIKLNPLQTYTALDVTGVNHLFVNEGGPAYLDSLAGGVDGQILTVTVGGFGGGVIIKNEFASGAPGEQIIKTQDGLDNTLPAPPALTGVATLQYVASQVRWVSFVH